MHNSRFTLKAIAVTVLTVLSALFIFSGIAFAQLNVATNQSRIEIDAFYHGSSIKISGDTDPGTDVIMKITSPEGESKLREKGKVGVFWMNTRELKFEHVPNLYLLYSTRNIKDIITKEEADKYVVGYPAMEKYISIAPIREDREKSRWFKEFVKFKEASGLYGISSGRISTTKNGGEELYNTTIDWPFQAPPGKYMVTVYEVKHGKVIGKTEASISVKRDGFVKATGNMANKNGALYGVLSITIALIVGFGISLVFKKA
ncbi:MAG: TIGR02186 family protein [Candidatus Aquicultor sp.]